jgi:plastocyanin
MVGSNVVKTFSSDNTAVATVAGDGTVTGVSIGTAHVTATVKVGSVTRTGVATITVEVPPAATAVTAPQLAFLPSQAHVSAGGTVTWNIGAVHHTVTFTTPGAPNSVPELLQESATRTFPTPGSYSYICSLHAGMTGTVHVH